MSTNKNLITGLCSGTLVSTYNNRQQADCRLEGPCGWINIRGAESIFKGHIEKFMVCFCRVSVGSVGDAWQAVLQRSMHTLKNKS